MTGGGATGADSGKSGAAGAGDHPAAHLWYTRRVDPDASAIDLLMLALWAPFGTALAIFRIVVFFLVIVPLFGLLRTLRPGAERWLVAVAHPFLGMWTVYHWKDDSSIYYRDFAPRGAQPKGPGSTRIVVSNHRSDYDWVPFQYRPFGILASPYWKKMNEFCAAVGYETGLIYARETPGGTSNRNELVREAIRTHLKTKKDIPLLAFPEGGTTNGTGMLRFNKFLFSLDEPVQPVALRVRNPLPTVIRRDWLRDNFLSNLFFFQFLPVTVLDVTFLPPMDMSDADRATEDPAAAFAGRVQRAIAQELEVPATDFSYLDKNTLRGANWNPGWF